MLNKTESKVMDLLYSQCKDKNGVLISPTDIIRIVDLQTLNKSKLDKTMNDLASDGYFDLVYSDRHGENIYCVTLTEKGRSISREKKVRRRYILFRIGLTCGLAVVSFLIGLLLKAIF